MAIPSSRSLTFWISVFSITSPSADFGRLRKTSDFFGKLRTSSGIFGNDLVVFKNPSTPRIKISRFYLRKSWQVYNRVKGSFSNEAAVLSGFSGVVWARGCELYWVKCRGNSKHVNIERVNTTILKQ